MKRTHANLIRVGLFTLVAGSLLVAGLLWIGGSRILRPRDHYTVLFSESVSGLSAGSIVAYQGVQVGRVRAIHLTSDIPPKVSVDIGLDPGTPVRQDTTAALRGSIVTGIQFVELEGGSEGAGPMAQGGVIPGSVQSLVDFRDRLARIADLAIRILKRFDEEVLTKENTERASQMLADLSDTANRLSEAVDAFAGEDEQANIAHMVDRVTRAADSVNDTFSDWNGRREGLYASLRSTTRELDAAIADGRAVLKRTREEFGPGGETATLLEDLSRATARLQETLDLIEADPSVLLRGREIPRREFER